MTQKNNENLKTEPNETLHQALYLVEKLNWSVIPVSENKKPLISWKDYQTRRPTKSELEQWFVNFPKAGIAVVTGEISNLVVFDIDPRNGGTDEIFKEHETVCVKTGGGGKHYYFKFQDNLQNTTNLLAGIDVRGEGGYIIAPPSTHNSGNKYEWIRKPVLGSDILELPKPLLELCTKKNPEKDVDKYRGVKEGKRNDSAASIIGDLLNRYGKEDWGSKVWPLVIAWNNSNQPPITEGELKITFDSICKKVMNHKQENKPRKTVADILIEMVFESGAILYSDQARIPHITLPEKPVVGYSLQSKPFKQWLSGKYWKESGKGFSSETFSVVVSTLEGKAFHEDKIVTLYNRVARHDGNIYYDIGDDKNIVKVDENGWEIINDSPVRFRRFSHQRKQILPKEGGNLSDLLTFVNLTDKTDKLLFITYVVAVLISDIPRVVIVNIGDQGSAKSTALRVIRSLIDPSSIDLLSPPAELLELAQAANHNYCLFLDNLSSLTTRVSDALCGLVTGVGFTKRKLFTDEEDILFDQKVAIGISGINLVAEKADLLDRCLILQYQRISSNQRKDELEFWTRFEEQKPFLLGALFSTLSSTLEISKSLKLDQKPRMADYAKYAASAAIALGNSAEEFIKAFDENLNRQNKAAIESSSTAQVIITFMINLSNWEGTSNDLYNTLKTIAEDSGLQMGGADGFPKSSNWLWRRIMQVRPNLESLGIKATKEETAEGTKIRLIKIESEKDMAAVATDLPQKDIPINNEQLEDFDTYLEGLTP